VTLAELRPALGRGCPFFGSHQQRESARTSALRLVSCVEVASKVRGHAFRVFGGRTMERVDRGAELERVAANLVSAMKRA